MKSSRTTRTVAAGTVAGLIAATGALAGAPAASAAGGEQEASRLPTLSEVTAIYPFLAMSGERANEPGRDLEAPGDADGSDCDYDRVAVRGTSGRGARYGNPDDTGFVGRENPTVLARGFDSRAAARSAYDLLRQRVVRCLGRNVRRDGDVVRSLAAVPRLGGARFAYRETGRYTDGTPYLTTRRVVVLRGEEVVVTSRARRGAGVPPAKPLVKLTRLALRTL